MSANTYNPHVEGKQHSASRLKIQNGPDALQVGWRVNLATCENLTILLVKDLFIVNFSFF